MLQLDWLFNLALAVDTKNLAIEKLKALKKTTASAEPVDAVATLRAADDGCLAEVAEHDSTMVDAPMEADTIQGV